MQGKNSPAVIESEKANIKAERNSHFQEMKRALNRPLTQPQPRGTNEQHGQRPYGCWPSVPLHWSRALRLWVVVLREAGNLKLASNCHGGQVRGHLHNRTPDFSDVGPSIGPLFVFYP
jgi:hypothetical protein